MATGKQGTILWHDLTVPDAAAVRDFYASVLGWSAQDQDCGGYSDFNMQVEGETVAGVCHARGTNANIPPAWLMYVQVDDVDRAAATALSAGGTVLDGPRKMGGGNFACIKDPAGAIFAIFSQP